VPKADKPQYTVDHDGNFLFVIKMEAEPRPDFSATVDVSMQGKFISFLSLGLEPILRPAL
jgi:hypothetical protein